MGIKKIYINESQEFLLTEGISNVLYHFTSLSNGYEICNDGVIYFQSAYAKDADNYDRKRKYYLSCTRIRNANFGYSRKFNNGGVRIVFDGNLLAQRYKGKPIMYWKGLGDKFHYYENLPNSNDDLRKRMTWRMERFKRNNPNATEEDAQRFIDYNFSRDRQEHVSNESEDRILSYEPYIRDAEKYIKSIDVLLIGVENDEEKMKMAQAFLWNTKLRDLVHIYDSLEEFNNPKGKDINDKIEYISNAIQYEKRRKGLENVLSEVICFIAYANPRFEKKNFSREVAKLLKEYELSEFNGLIGKIGEKFSRTFSVRQVADDLDADRRRLSDNPNSQTYKILKMMTDYFLSIGADSFREAFLKKSKIADEYFGHNGNIVDRIDTATRYNFLIIRRRIISLNPRKDSFADAMGWNDNYCRSYADSFAGEIMCSDVYNHSRSKNYNSMFQYIYKLFRKGSISQVYDTLKKIGLNDEYLKSWDIDMEYKDLDYWDAVKYDTVNTCALKKGDYDYMTVLRKNDREIEEFFKNKQKVR